MRITFAGSAMARHVSRADARFIKRQRHWKQHEKWPGRFPRQGYAKKNHPTHDGMGWPGTDNLLARILQDAVDVGRARMFVSWPGSSERGRRRCSPWHAAAR